MPKANPATAGSGKWTSYAPKEPASRIAWDEVDAALVGELVQEVTRGGDAVLFGQSRDGGTLVVTICSGAERVKFYSSASDECESQLRDLIARAKT
jgi:hypothetical protein